MEDTKDNKRSKNFKDSEVEVLLSLVNMHKDVLENKKTDATTYKEKEAVWKEIEGDFNSNSGVYYRDSKTLKKKYDNIKKITKRKFAEDKKYVLGTGGGPSQPSQLTNTDLQVRDIIGTIPIYGNESVFDSDAQVDLGLSENMIVDSEEDYDITQLPFAFEEELDGVPSATENRPTSKSCSTGLDFKSTKSAGPSSGNLNIALSPVKETFKALPSVATSKTKPFEERGFNANFSIKKLRGKTSSPLSFRKKTGTPLDSTKAGKKIENLAKTKEELLQLQKICVEKQIEYAEQEHAMRMKCMQEEHRKKMNLMDLQIKNEEFKLKNNG